MLENSEFLPLTNVWGLEKVVKENEAGIAGKFSPDPCIPLISIFVVLKNTEKENGFFWVLEKEYCLYSNKQNP